MSNSVEWAERKARELRDKNRAHNAKSRRNRKRTTNIKKLRYTALHLPQRIK